MESTKMSKIEEFLRESNAIEGVYDDNALKQAKYAWDYLMDQEELSTDVVLKTHKILMLNRSLRPHEKGYFRTVPVYIGGKEALHYSFVPGRIRSWADDARVSVQVPGENGKHIKLDHVNYEKIHPFVDGNGRTGRMFMNWQRIKAGLPVLVIKETEKYSYYKWFTEGSKNEKSKRDD